MPSARDFMVDPQTTPIGPPDRASELFKMISSLPAQYQAGAEGAYKRGQWAREQELQKPVYDEAGNLVTDPSKLYEAAGRIGGLQEQLKLLPDMIGMQSNAAILRGLAGGGGQPAAGIEPPQDRPSLMPAGQPITVRRLLEQVGADPETPEVQDAFAGIGLDRPLTTQDQQNAVLGRFERLRSDPNLQQAGMFGPPGAMAQAPPGAMAQAPQGTQAPQPPATFGQRFAPAEEKPMFPPTPQGTEAQAKALEKEGRDALALSGLYRATPAAAEGARKFAEERFARAKAIRDASTKAAETIDPRFRQAKGLDTAQADELKAGNALKQGLQGQARDFQMQLGPHLDAMEGIINDPNARFGRGEAFTTALNQIRAAPWFKGLPGYDPYAPLPNEAIRKVVAASILNQTTQLKAEASEMGGSAGKLFQQQIEQMQKAAQNPDNSKATLRYLTELQRRMGHHLEGVSELIDNYKGKFGVGVLDSGFNRVLAKYNTDNPIFTSEEIANEKLFAPPKAPVLHNKAEALAWAEREGVNPGDPIKIPGRNKPVIFDPSKL
jgi:hypothetical protein